MTSKRQSVLGVLGSFPFRSVKFCITLLLLFACGAQADQPNVVLLLADDLGYGELGCQGNPQIPTPHIDSIAATGMRFTQAYVTGPNCSPSRAGLLTGQFPTRFGYEFNPIGARNELPGVGLPPETITLAERLHDRGYTTGLIGKWHLGGAAEFHPQRHGFDEFFGFTHEGHFFAPPPYAGMMTMLRRKALPGGKQGRWQSRDLIYSTHMGHDEPDYDANNPIVRQSQPVTETEYLTDALTREAVSFIQRHSDRPFLLYLAYNAVHSPLQAKQEDLERVMHIEDIHRRIFAGMLISLDDSVGRILTAIENAGIADSTLVVFLSDNGGPTRELTSSNAPLRAGKGSMYEGGLRIPMLIRWPGQVAAGTVNESPISSLDLYPTLVELAGGKVPDGLDGQRLMDYWKNPRQEHPARTFYWRQGHKAALRSGRWKLVNMARGNGDSSRRRWELYDLVQDREEARNLALERPETLQRLIDQWESLDQSMQSPLFR